MALTDNLVSFWSLEEASGTRNDAHGTNHLTDNNTVTQAAGKVGNAALFTAANSESLSIVDNATLSVSDIDFMVAAWVFLASKGANRCPIGKWRSVGANDREYMLFFGNAADRFQFFVSPDGTALASVSADTLGSPALSTWYLVIAWHDSVANTINIQVNNGAVDSVAHTTGVFNGATSFSIGARSAPGTVTDFWDGRVDQALFSRLRFWTAEERTWLYNNGNGRSYAEVLAGIPAASTSDRGRRSRR